MTYAKLKEGIFIGPQIRKIILDETFDNLLLGDELAAWQSFKSVVHGFLGKRKDDNYRTLVTNLLECYKRMGCNMSLKIHFLHSHIDFSPENLGHVSDEQEERFHQDIPVMEKRYQGPKDPSMMGDCWFLVRESKQEYKRQHKRKRL